MNFIGMMKFKNQLEWERNELHKADEDRIPVRSEAKRSS
ncbi:hypothetical protein JOD29_003862 [Lysinibacillus composti]|nr:hypothetical protein [Lysinibacillus composti]